MSIQEDLDFKSYYWATLFDRLKSNGKRFVEIFNTKDRFLDIRFTIGQIFIFVESNFIQIL